MSDSRNDHPPPDMDDTRSAVSESTRRQLTTLQKLGIAGLITVVFLAFIWIEQLNRAKQVARQPQLQMPAVGGAFKPAPIVAAAPPPAVALPMPGAQSSPQQLLGQGGRREMTPAESPILAFSGASGSAGSPSAAATEAAAPGGPLQPPEPPTALAGKLRPTLLSGAKATMLPHPDMLMTEGTIIPCTLQTAINTELAGYVKCVLPQDVRSTTGNVILLDRGTQVVGEIQSGLMNGQDRVFVLWDRAETPDHAIIALNSPGTDELGRAGISGGVDNHFWKRFGSAIMLSVLQGALQSGTALAGNSGSGGTSTYFNSFQSNGQQLSNTALENSINIPPTLEKNQGDTVSIFVAKDLDFSDIYTLRVNGGYGAR